MFFLRILSQLPFSVLYLFSNFLFFVTYRLIKYRRKIVVKNLKNSFPESDDATIRAHEKEFYKNLCDYSVETLKLLTISEEDLKERMVYLNPEVITPYRDKSQSVIYVTSHQFNWEWLVAAGSIYLPIPVDFVYQPPSSKFFDQFSLLLRTRFGGHPIKRADVAREIIRRKDIVRGVAIVADQFPGHDNDKRYWTTFLNQDTAFFQGVNQLSYMTQYPVFFAKMSHPKRGYYEVELVKIGTPPYEKGNFDMIENYVKATEAVIKKDPAGWLWSHNRWKKKRTDSYS
ncbi:MAG: lysophospholipid acyltransferase family protein [Cyclobacteriaceae bacterium]|nr:lysophospholipid acyltransferase family protein [Cyclobacteriaceae bacterium]